MSHVDGILLCPACRAVLPEKAQWTEQHIACACGHRVPIVRGIPRFVPDDQYVGSFSFEWTTHATTQLDDDRSQESEEAFRLKTGLTPDDVRGKRVLDVGCGMGRFSDVVSRWGGMVVSIDLSLAVESAHANLGKRGNVQILQADIFNLPFAPESFDIVFSMGVMHHTPDCKRAFHCALPLVKTGGTIAIWVYGHVGAFRNFSDFYRNVTTRLPHKLLHQLCKLAVPLYYLYRIPLIGRPLLTIFPISMHPKAHWRVLDTFDWYAPRYQSHHTYPEVFRWFKEAGLKDIEVLDFPVALRGNKVRQADAGALTSVPRPTSAAA
jgi:SAM-dependent methyltransferase